METSTAQPLTANPPTAKQYDHEPVAGDRLLDELRAAPAPWRIERNPTGFVPLDTVLDGGLAPEELVVVGGRPGVGKTVAALQWAAASAAAGRRTVYVSYEHSPAAMMGRLLLAEAGALALPSQLPDVEKLNGVVRELTAGLVGPDEIGVDHPLLARAIERVRGFGEHLIFVGASGTTTDLAALGQVAQRSLTDGGILIVDYLQKVPSATGAAAGEDRAARVVEGLKELALKARCTVVAVAAADHEGLAGRRVRLHDFRGSTAIVYEADLILILEEKARAVSKVHAAFDLTRTPSFRDRVVFSLVKNRGGPTAIDLEFRKHFACFRFDPVGEFVGDKLVDDLLYLE